MIRGTGNSENGEIQVPTNPGFAEAGKWAGTQSLLKPRNKLLPQRKKKKPRREQNLQGDTRSQSAPDFSARRRSRCVQESMWYLFGFWGQGGSGRSLPVTANAASLSPRYLRTVQFYRWRLLGQCSSGPSSMEGPINGSLGRRQHA